MKRASDVAPSTFERVYFGEDPASSEELGAWLHPDGLRLRFTDDREPPLPSYFAARTR